MDAKICVVGVGGIGNPVVTQLTAMGVGKLRIVDRDIIEILKFTQGEHLYTEEDVGKVKVEVEAFERLKKINPAVDNRCSSTLCYSSILPKVLSRWI